ncbi:thioesterase [Streptomyces humidus]|uniref:Thioesterase n=2 Tax=Streptomyces humidus TaxID=52259 RepID=A0A918G4K5_9ACTN|nr:alpha/beta fold hydrolase [Streptomyces humidus]GGS16828.1 thioesterase [Streptomyces humidus]
MSAEQAALVTMGAEPPKPDRTLVCVPHAGGSAVAFHSWHRVFGPHGFAVRAVHWDRPAGSERRSGVERRAAALANAVRELPEPWILLGHSLGALIAAETLRLLEDSAGPLPERTVLCAAAPPGSRRTFPPDVLRASDAHMAAYVRRLGGTDESLLTDPEFGPQLLAGLRADLDLIERYTPEFTRPLTSPVSVYGAAADHDVPVASLEGWRELAPEARIRVFDGTHFFPHEDPAAVCRAVTADCTQDDRERARD